MQLDSKRPRQGGRLTQLAAPLAVLALLGITAKLTLDARAAERSHRATAESALRDYAAFASWQYSRQLASHMRGHLMMSLAPIRDLRVRPGAPLPPPRILSDRVRECGCGFKTDVALAFRLDIAAGRLVPDRDASEAMLRDLAAHLPRGLELITTSQSVDSDDSQDMLRRTAAIAYDTLAGEPFVLAYGLALDTEARPIALYGLASRVSHLAEDFRYLLGSQPLLPPSLLRGLPNDSLLAVRAWHPAAATIFATSVPLTANAPTHTDTLPAWLGGHVTTVGIRPELAGTLVIGGIPSSRLPLQQGLLAVAAALAIVALVQVRRTRELARMREQFVANVSHELRTPLAQISLLSETLMLGRERSEVERRDFAGVVYREARRLTTLVESVLRFSRGQTATTRVTPEVRNVAHDIRETIDAFTSIARASDVTISCSVAPDLRVEADPAAFRQVLLNLFDNAVKFGPPGQVIVVGAEQRNGEVALSVTDQGRGISQRDRHRVFDAYTRVDAPGAPAVTGAGIGLSVVRDLVQAHGGRVWIETPPGVGGTRVVFTLPRSA